MWEVFKYNCPYRLWLVIIELKKEWMYHSDCGCMIESANLPIWCVILLGLPVLLTLPVCFLQGDRGYEGPKGSRGPPGIGYKGDKVCVPVKHGWYCRHTYSENLWCCKGRPVWPLTHLTLRETQGPLGCQVWWGFQGQASKEKRQGKWKSWNLLALFILYLCNHILNCDVSLWL